MPKFEYEVEAVFEDVETVQCGAAIVDKALSARYAYERAQEYLNIGAYFQKREEKQAEAERQKHLEENIIPLAFDMYSFYGGNNNINTTFAQFEEAYRQQSYVVKQWVRTAETVWDKFNK